MQNYDHLDTLKLDPWAASSLLQKAIRRGDVGLAQYAARNFYRQRGNSIWRRLITIAFEDIGVGNPELVSDLTCLATDKNLRGVIDEDINLILDLCEKLSETPKDRSADYLFSMAMHHTEGQHDRTELFAMTRADQIEVAADKGQTLIRRAAAVLISCTENGEGEKLVRGDALCEFLAACQAACPSPLHDALAAAAQKSAHPFILMVPILWSAFSANEAVPQIVEDPVPWLDMISNIPLYTFDKHTRVGKQAINLLAGQNREVRETLALYVPPVATQRVAQMAAFYADAMPVSRRLDWSQSRSLEAMGREADMMAAGCPKEGIAPILDSVRSNLDHLNEFRRLFIRGRNGA